MECSFNRNCWRCNSGATGRKQCAEGSGVKVIAMLQDRPPEPHVTRVGSVFLLYAIYKAQPSLRRVRIYVPLHLLRGLTWMCQQSIEAAHVLKALWKEDAFVVGAVRRPISGSREAREAGRAVKT